MMVPPSHQAAGRVDSMMRRDAANLRRGDRVLDECAPRRIDRAINLDSARPTTAVDNFIGVLKRAICAEAMRQAGERNCERGERDQPRDEADTCLMIRVKSEH